MRTSYLQATPRATPPELRRWLEVRGFGQKSKRRSNRGFVRPKEGYWRSIGVAQRDAGLVLQLCSGSTILAEVWAPKAAHDVDRVLAAMFERADLLLAEEQACDATQSAHEQAAYMRSGRPPRIGIPSYLWAEDPDDRLDGMVLLDLVANNDADGIRRVVETFGAQACDLYRLDPNHREHALCMAIARKHVECVHVLLECFDWNLNRVGISRSGKEYASPLSTAVIAMQHLHGAAREGYIQLILRLLKHGADPHGRVRDKTAYFFALDTGQWDVADLLEAAGCTVEDLPTRGYPVGMRTMFRRPSRFSVLSLLEGQAPVAHLDQYIRRGLSRPTRQEMQDWMVAEVETDAIRTHWIMIQGRPSMSPADILHTAKAYREEAWAWWESTTEQAKIL